MYPVQYWGRPRCTSAARWLHGEHRQHLHPRRQRRHLPAQIRPPDGSRAGRAVGVEPAPAGVEERRTGERFTRIDRMGEATPRPVSTGTPGAGSIPEVVGILFENLTGTRLQFVRYRGAAPAPQDLIAGQIDMIFLQASNLLPQVHAGGIRAYAVTAPTRLNSAPEIPSVDEAGLPGLHATVWSGFWVPKGTPKDIIAKLNAAVIEALADAAVRQRLADLGLEIPSRDELTPESLGRLQLAP